MPVPGYDPDDVDAHLESKINDSDVKQVLTDEEWQSYQNDDTELIELLDESQIEELLDDESV